MERHTVTSDPVDSDYGRRSTLVRSQVTLMHREHSKIAVASNMLEKKAGEKRTSTEKWLNL